MYISGMRTLIEHVIYKLKRHKMEERCYCTLRVVCGCENENLKSKTQRNGKTARQI